MGLLNLAPVSGDREVAWVWLCLNSISLMGLFMHHPPQAIGEGRKRNKEEEI